VPGYEVQVRDELGRELPQRQVGTLFVRGPSVMSGYFGDTANLELNFFNPLLFSGHFVLVKLVKKIRCKIPNLKQITMIQIQRSKQFDPLRKSLDRTRTL